MLIFFQDVGYTFIKFCASKFVEKNEYVTVCNSSAIPTGTKYHISRIDRSVPVYLKTKQNMSLQ